MTQSKRFGIGWRENVLEVAMRKQKGTYQASCVKGIEEKKSPHLRVLQGKQHPQRKAQSPVLV